MPWLKRFIILLLLAALVLAGIKLVHMRRQQIFSVQATKEPALAVQTAPVSDGTLQVSQTYRGILRPERSIALSPRIQGRIVGMQGHAGEHIQDGQLLVRLDDRELQENIQALEAEKKRIEEQIWMLEKTRARQKKLAPGAISQDEIDRTLSNLNQAKSSRERVRNELNQARTRLSYTRLEAPLNGRIHKRLQEPGDMAQPGQPVMILEDSAAGYNIHIRVPAEVHTKLLPGNKVRIHSQGKTQKADITRIHPATSQNSPLVEVEAFMQKPPFELPSGSSLEVELLVSRAMGIIVPSRALLSQEKEDVVFTVNEENRIQMHQVHVLSKTADRAVLMENELQPGQRVVVGALSKLMRLSPGMKVETGPVETIKSD
jgi:RND family efflux transporter MFP subunit